MFFIHIIVFNVIVYEYFSWKLGSQFSQEDCYESFTVPKIFLKLFHYNPSGPNFFQVVFQSLIYYANNNEREFDFYKKYYFKKIDQPCESSLIFSTQREKIIFMEIIIRIKFSSILINAIYTRLSFVNGFKPGNYIFMDTNLHFGIPAKVIHSNETFMPEILNEDLKEVDYYLSSLSINKNNICILTENNRQVIISPIYHSTLQKGFIIGIKPIFLDVEYQAFECLSSQENRYETTTFIVDKYPKSPPIFIAIYAKWDGIDFIRNEISFSLKDCNLYRVNSLKFLAPNIKKVFLIRENTYFKKYPYFRLELFESNSKTIYRAIEYVYIEEIPQVKRDFLITYSPIYL